MVKTTTDLSEVPTEDSEDLVDSTGEDPSLSQKKHVYLNLISNKIKINLTTWKEVDPLKIFNMVKNGNIVPLQKKSYLSSFFPTSFLQNNFSLEKSRHLAVLINETMDFGVLSLIPNNSEIFPNNIFIVVQEHRTTKKRLIFDMS